MKQLKILPKQILVLTGRSPNIIGNKILLYPLSFNINSQVFGRKLDKTATLKVNPRGIEHIVNYEPRPNSKPKPHFKKEKFILNPDLDVPQQPKKQTQSKKPNFMLKKLLNGDQLDFEQIHNFIRSINSKSQNQTQNGSLNQTSSFIGKQNASVLAPKMKKKKKKSKTKKTKKYIQENKQQQKSNEQLNQIIQKNLMKKKCKFIEKKLFSLKEKQQKEKERQEQIEEIKQLKKLELQEKNREIRFMNAQRFQRSRSRGNRTSNIQIPWGLNQERLRNYLQKQMSIYEQSIQQKPIRTSLDDKSRREEIGVSFLNNLEEDKYKKLVKKKIMEEDKKTEQSQIQNCNRSQEIREYQEWKKWQLQQKEQQEREQELIQQLKIQQNLQNLDCYIKTKSRSQSDHQGKKRSKSQQKDKHKKLVTQFRNLEERFINIQQKNDYDDEEDDHQSEERLDELDSSFFSDRQYMATNEEQNHQKNEQFMVPTLGIMDEEVDLMEEIKEDMDEQEEKDLAEIRSIEKLAASRSSGRVQKDLLNEAAILIQKTWRGYKTRQILKFYLNYFDGDQNEQQNDEEQMDINQLSQSQIEELINLGYLTMDDEGNIGINQNNGLMDDNQDEIDQQIFMQPNSGQQENTDQSAQYFPEPDNFSSNKTKEQEKQQNDYQEFIQDMDWEDDVIQNDKIKEDSLLISDYKDQQKYVDVEEQSIQESQESPQQQLQVEQSNQEQILSIDIFTKIMEDQKNRWQGLLQYVSQLQQNQSQQDLSQILLSIKQMTEINTKQANDSFRQIQGDKKSNLAIDLNKCNDQNEQLIEQSSIFDLNPFKEFSSRKFKELINPNQMNQLLYIREKALESRTKSQQNQIKKAFHESKISPKTYDIQSKKLEKWVTKEREELHNKKKAMEQGWQCTHDTLLKTQRDIMFMKKQDSLQHQILPPFLANSFSQEHIKVVDNFHSESHSIPYYFSQSQSSVGYTPMKELIESQKINSAASGIIDIVQQNQVLQEKYLKYEEELSKSEEEQPEKTLITVEEFKDENVNVPHTSPSPSPKDSDLQSLCKPIRISDLVTKNQNDDDLKDKQLNSYSILITNMIIENEIEQLSEDLIIHNIDLLETVNRHLYSIDDTPRKEQETKVQTIKQSKGIKTNLSQVKLYLQKLEQHIQQNYIPELIRQINIPLGPTSKEILKYLHFNETLSSQMESSTDSAAFLHSAILTTELFANLEKQLMQEQFIKHQHEFLLELEHIHNKVVFDALNEALDQYRPFGLGGQPLPWKIESSKLRQRELKGEEHINKIVQQAEQKVVEWGQSLVGIIIDKEDSPFPKMLMLDQDYLNQIKEDRLLRMLQADILENEERWLNYDEEQTEIQVELSDMLFDTLICEEVSEIYKMINK